MVVTNPRADGTNYLQKDACIASAFKLYESLEGDQPLDPDLVQQFKTNSRNYARVKPNNADEEIHQKITRLTNTFSEQSDDSPGLSCDEVKGHRGGPSM